MKSTTLDANLCCLDDGLTQCGLCRFLIGFDPLLNGAVNDAWVGNFRVTDHAGFVDFLVGKTNVSGPKFFCIGRIRFANGAHFTALLRSIVFVGQIRHGDGFANRQGLPISLQILHRAIFAVITVAAMRCAFGLAFGRLACGSHRFTVLSLYRERDGRG
jgi:hypothetical protein